ncbi:MAG: phosphatidate cytidylyltransferase [Planctomycetes bacterium]|nr:phosphatidate cytidylyltransferase [Planctomycetota bacterium]
MSHWIERLGEHFRSAGVIGHAALVVLAILVLATAVSFILRGRIPEKAAHEFWARTRAWWVMATVFFGAILSNEFVALALFAFVSFWALKEYVTLLHTRAADHRALLWAFLSIPVQYLWIAQDWYQMFLVFIPVWMFLWLPLRLVLARETTGFVASASQIQWGLMAFVFGLSHLAWIAQLTPDRANGIDGRGLLLFLVFTVEMSDVLQFCFGKLFGRHKILPGISPNKTWEGFVLGVVAAALLALVLRSLTPFSVMETIGVALVANVAGFAGGAVMSAVKRDFGVKDFGTLLPGHGGMIDRVDSLCYAAPAFYHIVRFYWL